MTINGNNFDKIRRVEGVDPNQRDDHRDKRERRKVNYQGRMWEEAEEGLPLQPRDTPKEKEQRDLLNADPRVLQKINKLYQSYTTLEDKIAGICFFETEAYYDALMQKNLEETVQHLKIGGVLFTKGEYKRQHYLIERYQELAQVPLLMGNDFTHGLTYYFHEGPENLWGEEMMNVKYFSDLGRAVMSQNRNLGVHFQLSETRGKECDIQFPLSEELLKAFRKGIRDARGIISFFGYEHTKFATLSLDQFPAQNLFSGGEIREVFSLKTLTFFDMTSYAQDVDEEILLAVFKKSTYDALLFSLSQKDLIVFITECVKNGKIAEKDIEKRLMKILALNIKCQKESF